MFTFNYQKAIAENCGDLKAISKDMYITPFWKESFCKELVDYFNNNPSIFNASNPDGYDASEVLSSYISKIFTLEILKQHHTKIFSQMCNLYQNLNLNGYFDPYFVRYNHKEDKSNKLRLHNDISGISSLVKINEDFEGGETVFPRQEITTKEMPVGHILIWPGQVTHPHEVNPVTKGIKYSLTIWTLPTPWANNNVVYTNEIMNFK